MGLISNLDFTKATETRRNLEDGDYEVEVGLCYNKLTNNAGARAFTEFKVLDGPRAGVEEAQRQAFNNMTAQSMAQTIAACLGFDLTIPAHKEAFDSAYTPKALQTLSDEIWEGKNLLLKGKRAHVRIQTIRTKNQQDFRKYIWSPKQSG